MGAASNAVFGDNIKEDNFSEAEVERIMARLGWTERNSDNYHGVARTVAHALSYARLNPFKPATSAASRYNVRECHVRALESN